MNKTLPTPNIFCSDCKNKNITVIECYKLFNLSNTSYNLLEPQYSNKSNICSHCKNLVYLNDMFPIETIFKYKSNIFILIEKSKLYNYEKYIANTDNVLVNYEIFETSQNIYNNYKLEFLPENYKIKEDSYNHNYLYNEINKTNNLKLKKLFLFNINNIVMNKGLSIENNTNCLNYIYNTVKNSLFNNNLFKPSSNIIFNNYLNNNIKKINSIIHFNSIKDSYILNKLKQTQKKINNLQPSPWNNSQKQINSNSSTMTQLNDNNLIYFKKNGESLQIPKVSFLN